MLASKGPTKAWEFYCAEHWTCIHKERKPFSQRAQSENTSHHATGGPKKKNTTKAQKAGMKLEISPFPVPAQCQVWGDARRLLMPEEPVPRLLVHLRPAQQGSPLRKSQNEDSSHPGRGFCI